jgi:hypothetical protein
MPRPQNPNLNFHNLIVLVSKLRRKLDAQIEAASATLRDGFKK